MRKLSWIVLLFLAACGTENKEEPTTENETQIVEEEVVIDVDPLEEIEKDIISNPESPNGYYKRAIYYQDKYEFDKAIDDINRALKLAPETSSINYTKAEILYKAAMYKWDLYLLDETKVYCNYAIELDSSNFDAYLLLAEIQLADSSINDAMKNVNSVMKMNDQLARPYFVKGEIYEKVGNFKLAESSYQTAIEKDAGYYNAYVRLGTLYASKGDELALTYYNAALDLNSNSIEALRNKGLFYHFSGQFSDARKSFEKIVEIDPTFEEAYFNIGNTYIGQYDDAMEQMSKDTTLQGAIDNFNKAIELNPNYVQAIYNLGIQYQVKGDNEAAKAQYHRALEIEPGYMPALDALNSM